MTLFPATPKEIPEGSEQGNYLQNLLNGIIIRSEPSVFDLKVGGGDGPTMEADSTEAHVVAIRALLHFLSSCNACQRG